VKDDYRHKGLRKQLVEELAKKGITSEKVLQAINRVPRHLFFDNALLNHAYQDKAFPIGEGQTISQPYTVAYQSQHLDIRSGEKVLEIGTGSGYQASILYKLGARVYSIERHRALHIKTTDLLDKLGYNTIKTFCGDGTKGEQ
jgi:protein-L-isoaspartate(D-aspartate) O-methyltransferase